MPEINQCTLTARLMQIDKLRRSPAGVLRCRLWVEHRSRQTENNHPVEVNVRIAVLLVGNHWASLLEQLQLGMTLHIEGYLTMPVANKRSDNPLQLQATQLSVTQA